MIRSHSSLSNHPLVPLETNTTDQQGIWISFSRNLIKKRKIRTSLLFPRVIYVAIKDVCSMVDGKKPSHGATRRDLLEAPWSSHPWCVLSPAGCNGTAHCMGSLLSQLSLVNRGLAYSVAPLWGFHGKSYVPICSFLYFLVCSFSLKCAFTCTVCSRCKRLKRRRVRSGKSTVYSRW